jgi:hypothetical protein
MVRGAHSPPGLGNSDPAAGGLRLAAGPGTSHSPLSIFFSRLMSVSYGVGAALTLDEFAIWLNLEPDAYWSQRRAAQHRRRHPFRQPAGGGRVGRALLPRPGPHVGQARALFGKELGRGLTFPIRRARLLRPRKVVDQAAYRAVITRRFSFIEGVSSPDSCVHSSAPRGSA